jgi:hypothetical protein
MPLHHRVLPDQALLFVEAWRVLTDTDVLTAQERLRADPDFQGHYIELVDLQRVSAFEVSSETIRQLAQQDVWGSRARRAFVVTPGVAFGLARMFELLTDQRPTSFECLRRCRTRVSGSACRDLRG